MLLILGEIGDCRWKIVDGSWQNSERGARNSEVGTGKTDGKGPNEARLVFDQWLAALRAMAQAELDNGNRIIL
jgi:hypothetical protein